MKRRKSIIIPLTIAFFALSGCFVDNGLASGTSGPDVSMSSKPGDVKTISGRVGADYGSLEEGATTFLFGDVRLPFSPEYVGVDYAAVGDFVEISYKGEWTVSKKYPDHYDWDKATIVGVKVTHCHIAEFEVAAVPGGGKSLRALDASVSVGELSTANCIYRDRTFEEWESYPARTKIYGICSAKEKSAKVFALYSYDPSERRESLTLKESYGWIGRLKEEDIAMVISGYRHGSICPTFETLDYYTYSYEPSEIQRTYEYLSTAKIVFDDPEMLVGGGLWELIVVTKTGEKHYVSVSEGRPVTIFDGRFVSFDTALPMFPNLYGNGFLWQSLLDMKVSNADGTIDYTDSFPRLESFEDMIFQEIENPSFSGEPNEYNAYKFSCDCGEIVFESNTAFMVNSLEGKTHYYRIVNEVTFNYLRGRG